MPENSPSPFILAVEAANASNNTSSWPDTYRFSHALFYTIFGIFFGTLLIFWGMTLVSPEPMVGLVPMSAVLLVLSLYSLVLARGPTQVLTFDHDQLLMGKDLDHLYNIDRFKSAYLVTNWVRYFYVSKSTLMVLRDKPCIPLLSFFGDILFPACNEHKQVIILLTGWRDPANIYTDSDKLAERIGQRCINQGIPQKKLSLELAVFCLLVVISALAYLIVNYAY